MQNERILAWNVDLQKFTANQLAMHCPDNEAQLEELLARKIFVLKGDLLLIGRQLNTPSGPLDLLCVDSEGNVFIIELKKDLVARYAIAQA